MKKAKTIDYVNFLRSKNNGQHNVELTITLKQSLPTLDGGRIRIDKEIAADTAKRILNRINKKILGRRFYKKNKSVGAYFTLEGGDGTKRLHFHAALWVPEHFLQRTDYKERLFDAIRFNNQWVYREIAIETENLKLRWDNYCVKTGGDSILLNTVSSANFV